MKLKAIPAVLLFASSVNGFSPLTIVTERSHHGVLKSVALEMETAESSTVDSENLEFPPPLTPVERLQRAASFWSTAIPIVANYYGQFAEMKLREVLLGETMSEEEVEVRTFVQSCTLIFFWEGMLTNVMQ